MKKYIISLFFLTLTTPTFAIDCSNMWNGLTSACELGNQINDEGKQDLYLTGWSRHNRHRYSADKINEFQEFSYGGGIGKSHSNTAGNTHSVYGLALADSHNDPQLTIGYHFQAYWGLVGDIEAGLGYTFGLASRRDIWQGIPFPYILPLLSLRYRSATLMATYIPYVRGKQNGDVIFLLGKYTFN